DDEFGWLLAAVGNRQERAHFELLQLRPVEHLAAEIELLRQGLRPLGEIGRSANIGGKITEIAREIHAVCDRQSPRRGRLARSEVAALWHGEGELAQRPADLRWLARPL